MSRFVTLLFRITILLTLCPVAAAHGEEVDPLRFRRVEIPSDRVSEFAAGMLPVPRREFESLVSPEQEAFVDSFESATYVAKLQDNQLTQGTASLVVSDGAISSDRELLTVGGNLAMTDARWKRKQSFPPAIFGNSDIGPAVLADPLAKEFQFRWSQRGETRDNVHYFDLRFPNAFVQELLLEVPANLNVIAPGVLAERQSDGDPSETTVWSIRWSGRSRIRFAASPEVDSAATANIDSRYLITDSDVQLQTQIELVGRHNKSTLALTVDPSLTVAKVTADESPTLFMRSEASENTILIELPTPDNDDQLEPLVTLQVEAIGKFPMNKLQSLPRLRPVCKWKSETVRCRIDDSIQVADLKLQRCECRSLKRMASSGGEWFAFDMKSETADIQFRLERNLAEFVTESLIVHRLQDDSVLAESEIKFRPFEGELFDLDIEVQTEQGWAVNADSIEVFADTDVSPSSLLIDTPQIANGNVSLRLREAATAARPINVRFALQNNTLATKPSIAVPQLNAFRVPNSSGTKSWIYIKDTPGVEIAVNGSEHGGWQSIDSAAMAALPTWIQRRTANELVPSDKDLFLRYSAASALIDIARTTEQSQPTLQSKTRIAFNDQQSRYALEIEIDPLGKEMNSLVVNFSSPTGNENWTFVGRTEKPVVNRTDARDNRLESHQLLFPPIAEPFHLKLEFDTNATPQTWHDLPLPTVANVTGGNGSVSLATQGSIDLDIRRGNALESLPVPSQSIEKEPLNLRALYRYDDTAATPPSLEIQTLTRTTGDLAWAWRTDLRSYYAEEGRPRHRADIFVQTEAETNFAFELPLGFLFEKAEIDGVAVEPSRGQDGEQQRRFEFTLPAANRNSCITIKYVEADRTLRPINRLKPPLPKINLPSMQNTWQIWLPHDYRIYQPRNANSQSWLRRLVGFLATPQGLELEASIIRSVKRKWIADVDDPLGLIHQIEILLGPDWPYSVDENDDDLLRWGPRLQRIATDVNRSRGDFELLIDREEVRRIGVFASSELPKATYASPRQMGISRLSQSGLVIVVEGKRALITSASEARRKTRPTDWVDAVGADGIVDSFGTNRLLPVDEWINDEFEQLWRPSRDELEIGLQRAGWSPNRNNVDLSSQTTRVYHRDTIMALACSIFCFGFAWGWRFYQTQRRRCFTLCSVAMAAALLLPQPGGTLAVAFGWSMFASGLLRYAMQTRRLRVIQSPVFRKLSPTRAASWIVLSVLLSLGASDEISAQERLSIADVAATNEQREKERFVYFPTDSDRQPMDTIYVDPDFYRAIKQRKNANKRLTPFLLTKTKYAGELPTIGSVVELNATYNVTTLSENVRFPIPSFGMNGTVSDASLRVNRKPIAATVINGNPAIQLPSAGDYRITFNISATIERTDNNIRLQMPIPVAPDSVVDFRVPRTVTVVESSTAIGQQTFDKQNRIFSANLGPASTLQVTATVPASNDEIDKSNLPTVEQNTRVIVDNEKVTVFVQFEYVDEAFGLQIDIDPALVPSEQTQQTTRWNPQTSTLDTRDAPLSNMQFEFERDETTRRFKIPAINVVNANVAQNRLAVSSGSQTNIRIDDEEVESLSAEDFLGVWEDINEEPDLYVRTTKELPEIEVVAVPLVEDWSSDISYFFDQIETRVEVKAQLVPQYDTPQMIPFRRIRVPGNLAISKLTAATPFDEIRIRWRQHGDEVTIFFLDEVEASSNAPIEIDILATVPTRDLNALSVVEFVSDRVDNASVRNVVHIYRAANVDIILEGSTAPFVPEAVNPDVPARPGYILHGVWTSDTIGFQSSSDALTIRRTTLDRSIEGKLTTRLVYDDVWWAEIATELTSDVDVDAIYFDLPASLCSQPPLAYEGDTELRVDAISGGSTIGRRIVAVWLPPQDNPNRTIDLVARLAQDRTSLPDVRLVNVRLTEVDGQPQRFAELPVASKNERTGNVETTLFNWKLSGLVLDPSTNIQGYKRYRIAQSDGSVLLDETPASMQAEVILLHTRLAWHENKSYVAMSEFDVKPADQSRLLLELPPGAELIQVFCDEKHTSFSKAEIETTDSGNAFHEFHLNSSPWPQRVRVIFRGVVKPGSSRRFSFQAPALFHRNSTNQLQPLSVDEELWSVSGPRIYGRPSPNPNKDRRIDKFELDTIQLDSFTELWSRAQASIRERSREEKTQCLRNWTNYLRDTINRYEANENESQPEIELLMVNYPDAFSFNESTQVAMAHLWRESQWTDGPAIDFRSDPSTGNDLPSLELLYKSGPLGSWPRYLLAIGVLAFGVFIPKWRHTSRILDHAFSEPHMTTAVFGFFWCLFLSPYWIGIFLILLALSVWTWSRFRTYQLSIRR